MDMILNYKGGLLFSNARNNSSYEIKNKVRRYEESIKGVELHENPLDQFIISLEENYITSEDAENYISRKNNFNLIHFIFGIILIIGGLSIIFIPIPSHLEIYTLLYFNPDDGITISDLVALLVICIGSYLLIKNIKDNW